MEYRRGSTTAFAKILPNGHSFNGRSIYDGVFGGRRESGRSGVADYGEIFGGSGASIPVLDVPELNESKMVVDVRSSKLDYSKVFGGVSEFDFAASHEELNAKPKMGEKTPAKARSHSESSFPSNFRVVNEVSSDEASNQSFDGKKKFNVSYNKTDPGSKNGTNGTMHVAQLHEVQLHEVPVYSFQVDEMIPSQRAQGDKPVSSASRDSCPTINFSGGMMEVRHCRRTKSDLPPDVASKLSSKGDNEFQKKSNGIGSDQNGMSFDIHEVGLGKQPSRVPRASSLPNNTSSKNCSSSKSWASMRQSSGDAAGLCSPPYFDEEVDVNSVAATSAAAVKKAIEEAQARIKMAKELKERKKQSQQNHTKASSNAMKAEERKESKDTGEERKFKGKAPVQTFSAMRKQNAINPVSVAPDLGDREKLIIDNEGAGETHGKNFRSFQANHGEEEIEERKLAGEGEKLKDAMGSLNEFEPEEKNIVENQKEDCKKVEAIEEATKHVVEDEMDAVTGLCDLQEAKNKLKSADEVRYQKEDKNKLIFARIWEKIEGMLGVSTELEASESKLIEAQKLAENKKRIEREELKDDNSLQRSEDAPQCIDNEEKQYEALKQESGTRSNDALETEEDQTILQDGPMEEECGKTSEEASEIIELEEEQKESCGLEEEEKHKVCSGEYTEKVLGKNEKMETIELGLNGFGYGEENEKKLEENDESRGNQEESRNVIKEAYEIKENEEIQKWNSEGENTEMIQEQTDGSVEDEKTEETEEAYEIETEVRQKGTSEWEDTENIQEQTDQNVDCEKTEDIEEALKCHRNVGEATEDAYEQVEINNLIKTKEPCKHEHFNGVEITPEVFVQEENVVIEDLTEACLEVKSEAVEVDNDDEYTGVFDASGFSEGISDLDEIKWQMENAREAFAFDRNGINVGVMDLKPEQMQHDQHAIESEILCNIETHVEELACESEESNQDVEGDGLAVQQENRYSPVSTDGVRWVDNGESIEADQPPCTFEGKEETVGIASETETNESTVTDGENHYETLIETETKATSQKEIDLEKEDQRKRDGAKEREREREKERLAVERAVREARERALAEARETAERVAAERANVEERRRTMSGARGKWEKPSSEASDKVFIEARLKAERAAVERATAEARQRALEKAMSEKGAFQARNKTEKFPAERLSGSSRDSRTKHTVRSYDSHSNGSHPPASSRYPNSSNNGVSYTSERFDGANGEPAQRCKARLERHQRTTERAAKALAEKNMRDLIAQKEQAERDRLAETLDAEVKRWSKGKEGNLRALLSTLQYILGPESGWQPIPLTDLIATAAVKKAYRKATLFVHPDKLQQRGASIQQKYTCEKVFDLLKAAWNKFNAEER
ncbi:hypothetical protein SLA2020_142760 [Shorea laevis]